MTNKINELLTRFEEKQILLTAGVITLVVSFFSVGFHHFDEHFQIIEFMNFKLGGTKAQELPWEFHRRMRPWFQPYLYLIFDTPLRILGASPFSRIFFLRVISGLFSLFSLYFLYKKVLHKWFDQSLNSQRKVLAVMLLTWYIPYVGVRPSAESLSISLFLLGLGVGLSEKPKTFIASLLFGLSYLCRYQVALPVAVLWFWCAIKKRWSVRQLFNFAVGIIIIIAIGIGIDSYGYRQFTFALYNYFKANFLDGVLKQMGEDPWYKYFEWSIVKLIPPISLGLFAGVLLFWKKEFKSEKSWLTWITLTFILFHSAIGHKEYRFIFLCAVFAPIMTIYTIKRRIHTSLIILNFLLIIVTLKPANKMIPLYKHLYFSDIETIYYIDEDPKTLVGLPLNFYFKKNFKSEGLRDQDYRGKAIFTKRFESTKLFLQRDCKPSYLNYPTTIFSNHPQKIKKFLQKQKVMGIFRC